MPKPHKFPNPQNTLQKDALIFCPNDRIIKLFNQHTGKKAKAMGKAVKDWFIAKSIEEGWAACWPLPIVQKPTKSAGCVLFNPDFTKIEHHTIYLQFDPSEDL